MITGGRNIANDYFDLGERYNFIDSDIWIQGEIVKTARQSFDTYYDSELSKDPDMDDVSTDEEVTTEEFFGNSTGVQAVFASVEQVAERELKEYACNNVEFITDPPAHGEARRLVFKSLIKIAEQAKNEIVIESPYFVLRKEGLEALENIEKKGVRVEVLTNALHATDAVYAVGAIFLRFFQIRDLGLELWAMSGERPQEASVLGESARWGLHAKRAVIDQRHVLVGTYNIDPRSANLNSELLLICKDSPELAQAVLKSYRTRRDKSYLIFADGKTIDSWGLTRGATARELALMFVTLPLSNMFDFLL